MQTWFTTGTTIARHMAAHGGGVIIGISANAAREAYANVGGFGVATGAIEHFIRQLAVENGPFGVRVCCVRSPGSPDSPGVREVFGIHAAEQGITLEEFIRTLAVMERFSRFNLPIHFTENTLVSGHLMPLEIIDLNDYQPGEWPTTREGEERQAQEVVRHYKTLLSHPAVHAISLWDLSDGGWLNAPAGLLRHDHSPKPSYEALLKLVKGEWWLAPAEMRTDASGRFSLCGFLGEYALLHKDRKVTFTLTKPGNISFTLSL